MMKTGADREQISASSLARESYRAMELYAPHRPPCAFDLSDNTNLVGLAPSARAALERAASSTFTRYPSLYGADLKRALADFVGVSAESIVTGCGSDDILDSAIRAFTGPGEALAFPDPTFSMLPSFARMNSLVEVPIPLTLPTFDVDADRFVESRAKVSYVCTPNNPTGSLASAAALDHLIRHARGVVIVDEAYIEYAEGTASLATRATTEERLLVVRTLSKAFGMAGMRVGYGIGSPALVAAVEKSRGPYKVTALSEAMAVAALDADRGWVRACVADVIASREKMAELFADLGHPPLPSSANFLLVPVGDKRGGAQQCARALFERGVGVRPFPAAYGVGDALRVSVGPWSIMERTRSAFEEVLG